MVKSPLLGQTVYVDANTLIYALETPALFSGLQTHFVQPFLRGDQAYRDELDNTCRGVGKAGRKWRCEAGSLLPTAYQAIPCVHRGGR